MTPSPDPGSPEPTPSAPEQSPTRARAQDHECRQLTEGWQAAAAPPDAHTHPADLDALDWVSTRVPGTAAGALADAEQWSPGEPHDFDAEDWWFRTSFDGEIQATAPGERVLLCLDGIATVAEVHLNGELVLESDSMFEAHTIDVGERLLAANELAIRCRALGPLLRPRRRPRARWRTRLVAEGNLRFFRTMLLGRAPGFAPGPAAVGPWRAVRLERHRRLAVEGLSLRPHLRDGDGVLAVEAQLSPLGDYRPSAIEVELTRDGTSLRARLDLQSTAAGLTARGELLVPEAALWWPHTHGEPALYEARLLVDAGAGESSFAIDAGRVGFRTLAGGPRADHDVLEEGLDLHLNGERVFARGAVWTPVDAVGMAPGESELRAALERVVEAGMNMLRVPGTSAYEEPLFYDLCDELGLLVWQDFMFANLDYPIADDAFRASVEREATQVLGLLGGRPSLAVLCGNSEIEQQVAMLGLDASLGRGELFGELLPDLARAAGLDAIYLPSAPSGGELPFRANRGVANYYGVGGYRRPLEDARRAEVRFAAECLAFANVPDEQAIEALLPESPSSIVVHHPRWKAGVPRDSGTGWDFDDVRDHYLGLLYGVDPAELRRVDHERYLELSRAVSGEAMAEVFGEWRRAGSPCGGGLVLWLRDLQPGAGWGVLDHRGEPKVAYHHLRRALAPVAVWTSDEGLGGIVAHVANDRPSPLTASLRVAMYRDCEQRVEQARIPIELPAHGSGEWNVETLIGHFVDAAWAYRFGPPAQDLIVATLERDGSATGSEKAGSGEARIGETGREGAGSEILAQSFRFPAGRPHATESAANVGLEARLEFAAGASARLRIRSRRLAYGVRVHVPGHEPSDDAFSVEPGGERVLELRRRDPEAPPAAGALTALNVRGRVAIQTDA